MSPLQRELSSLEVEPLEIVEPVPDREGFDTPPQESSLDTITLGEVEVTALLMSKAPFKLETNCCCCCCPVCCC